MTPTRSALPGIPTFASPYGDEEDATLLAPAGSPRSNELAATQECCLVQIYPPDMVNGMLLLEQDVFSIGREPENDLSLPDSSVSRRHAEFRRSGCGYDLVDQGSTNGSLVNGQPVSVARLQSGDTVKLGHYMFKFLSAGSVESQYHETVYSAITRDALTGAVNRRYLMEALPREIARSARQACPLAVIMLDIDHFKSINDTHGHLVGDEVLREFGKRVQTLCREEDLLARYGGEEFCLVLFGSEHAEAIEMAERCRCQIASQRFSTAAGELPVTASFGVAVLQTASPQTPHDLLHQADQKLYKAKHQGRNQVC